MFSQYGPRAAEIDPVVWGTPANFNGFRVLAALLHGTLVVGAGGVSQTLPPIFGMAAITLGISPRSSSLSGFKRKYYMHLLCYVVFP